MMTKAFTAFSKAAGVGSVADLIALHLFSQDLGECKALGSGTNGYAPLESWNSLEASIWPLLF